MHHDFFCSLVSWGCRIQQLHLKSVLNVQLNNLFVVYEENIGTYSAYILFKDHKENFNNHKQARLINPTKTGLGLVSKNVIQKVITKI